MLYSFFFFFLTFVFVTTISLYGSKCEKEGEINGRDYAHYKHLAVALEGSWLFNKN